MSENIKNQSQLESLNELLDFTCPSSLRKSVQASFFSYLKEQDKVGFDVNYKAVVEDHEFLLTFIDGLES